MKAWESILEYTQEHLLNADRDMVAAYEARVPSKVVDHRNAFSAGDWVLMKHKQPGKNKIRATGPYQFIEYCGRRGITAYIQKPGEDKQRVSIANIIPFQGSPDNGVHEMTVKLDPPMVNFSSSSGESSDSED